LTQRHGANASNAWSLTTEYCARMVQLHNEREFTMNDITKETIKEFTLTGEFDIAGEIKPDKESVDEKKSFTLRFLFNQVPLIDLIHPALSTKKINWATNNRKRIESVIDKAVIKVDFKGGRVPTDTKEDYKRMYAVMSPEEKAKAIAELQAM
jgi:hypothetical protein